MTRILSGIRPSGKLHLGNYLGAIKNWIELQNKKNVELCVFMIADYHGITTPFDSKNYKEQILDTACEFLSAGLDPKKVLLIRQSQIPQHTELAWIFNTITPVGWLDRLPTYKEKQEQIESSDNPKKESWRNNMGILGYPVLMSADVLIYKANLVPVGDDQMPNLDVANEIVKKFNYIFGETFEPIKAFKAEGARIRSLQDPAKKMSKTGDEGIALTDSPDQIREKIKKAVTDSGKEIKYDEKGKPAISNLITIYQLLSGKSREEVEKMYDGKTYVDFKNDLAEVIVSFLTPFQKKYNELKNNLGEVRKILETSEEKAREEAQKTLNEVKQKIGLL
ncbi:MAG: tryptophan--tRNA ligase [Parcubacteria group bacterium]|nr:tryptophan--tRNA ligase [Parcubacteria group bacterium]